MAGPLHGQAIKGIGWGAAGQIARQSITLATAVLLARFLMPEDFGLFAMAQVLVGFALLFSDLGLGSALIQSREIDQRRLSTVFWANASLGGALGILMAMLSMPIASFYGKPELAWVVTLLGLQFPITALAVVHRALLQRDLALDKLFRIDLSAFGVAGLAAVTAAYLGFGVWSLVVQALLAPVVGLAVTARYSLWRPALVFSVRESKDLFHYGLHLSGFNVFNYWARNLDNLLIGKYLGAHALGVYSLAYRLMLFPISAITSVFGQVMLPILSRLQDKDDDFREIYLKACRVVGLVSFPLVVGLFVLAEPLIELVLGSQWRDAVPVFQILAISGLLQPIGATIGWIYTARARTDLMLRWGVVSGVVYMLSFLAGLNWGVQGVALAYVLAGYLFLWYPSWTMAGRLVGLSFQAMLVNVAGGLSCALAMGVLMAIGDALFIGYAFPDGFRLPWAMMIGVVSYFTLLRHFRVKAFDEVRAIMAEHNFPAARRS